MSETAKPETPLFTQTRLRIASYQARGAMAPHCHDEASMNIVVRGDFVERIGRAERNYTRGHVAYCPAGVTHSQMFGVGGAKQIIFSPEAGWRDYLADNHARLDESPHAHSPTLRVLGEKLLEEMTTDDGFSAFAREGLMLEIIAAFGRDSAALAVPSKPPAWLRAVRDFLHENAFAPVSMAQLARAAGRHEVHVAREFRRHFHVSIGAYLRRLRTEHAAQLLLTARFSISEIAVTCGFASHSHLCREFKVHYRVTPSQYRNHNR
jgi:AraC family transcriptional regulator